MNMQTAASAGLLERLSQAPWWWSIIAGVALVAVSYGLARLNGKAEDNDASCVVGLLAIVFAFAGAYAIVSGLFGW